MTSRVTWLQTFLPFFVGLSVIFVVLLKVSLL